MTEYKFVGGSEVVLVKILEGKVFIASSPTKMLYVELGKLKIYYTTFKLKKKLIKFDKMMEKVNGLVGVFLERYIISEFKKMGYELKEKF